MFRYIQSDIPTFRKLSLPAAQLEKFSSLNRGMVLVTGPTGSGKTTTLYACLAEIQSTEDKIITIEDPVEYQIPGIVQVPVNEKKGLTFARGLRSILRHDPDVIVFDEPTASLGQEEVDRLFSVVWDLKGHGIGMVYISHRLEEIIRLADRITVLRDGRTVGELAIEPGVEERASVESLVRDALAVVRDAGAE